MADPKVWVRSLPDTPIIDEVGPCYDLVLDWVAPVLPVGASDPDGTEFLVEISSGSLDSEEVRDEIRDAAIALLNSLPGFAAVGLTRGDVKVNEMANVGDDALFAPAPAQIMYPGPGLRPNIPTLLTTPQDVGSIATVHYFDTTLIDELKEDIMTVIVYFDAAPTLTKLRYKLMAYDITSGSLVWSQVLTYSSLIASSTLDLTLVGQAALWTAYDVRFTVALERFVSGYDIPPDASGRIVRATLSFQRL